ncbi:uncharacterized protein BDR25DRAFT_356802 [Lindgomyces ingoldianus]|uniref:Uncharacterized protein n=1 Tax=Lindgomyces ingoldianus TaxID=673940 RepID=A0ACB6QPY5_9PLEO|nr:uncharacterized protein BDR25DRAFT_356802 [Lindgomyces ingoldianus]KAF2469038.1 hypothetical protein BDR25DRAFT_356802 [Lindgomyces ingoldianus]
MAEGPIRSAERNTFTNDTGLDHFLGQCMHFDTRYFKLLCYVISFSSISQYKSHRHPPISFTPFTRSAMDMNCQTFTSHPIYCSHPSLQSRPEGILEPFAEAIEYLAAAKSTTKAHVLYVFVGAKQLPLLLTQTHTFYCSLDRGFGNDKIPTLWYRGIGYLNPDLRLWESFANSDGSPWERSPTTGRSDGIF